MCANVPQTQATVNVVDATCIGPACVLLSQPSLPIPKSSSLPLDFYLSSSTSICPSCFVEIVDGFTGTSFSSNDTFEIRDPLLQLLSPSLGDKWGVGSEWYFEWMCEAPVDLIISLTLWIDSVIALTLASAPSKCSHDVGGAYNALMIELPFGTNTTRNAQVSCFNLYVVLCYVYPIYSSLQVATIMLCKFTIAVPFL